MATLGKIRSWGWLLIVIVGLAMLAFILGDFFTSTSSFANRNAQVLAEIDGEEVSIQEFSASIEEYTEMIKSNYNIDNLTEAQHQQIRQQVWDNLVAEKILKKQGKEIGITVTEQELVDRTVGDNLHPLISRIFPNKEGLSNFLSYINTTDVPEDAEQAAQLERSKRFWLYQVNAVRQSLLQEKYINLMQSGVAANSLEAKCNFDEANTTADVQYVSKQFYTMPDSLFTVSDSEVKALYNKRKEGYKQQPNRSISYVAFDIKPSDADFKKALKDIQDLSAEFTTSPDIIALVNSNSDVPYVGRNYSEQTVPEQFKEFAFSGKTNDCTEILFADDTYSIGRIMQSGYSLPDTVALEAIVLNERNQQRIDSIKDAVKRGAAWADLVKVYNPDTENGGDFGRFSEEDLSTSLSQMRFPRAKHVVDSAFNLKVNDVFALAAGRGAYVFHIKEQTAPTPKVKLAILAVGVNPSRETINSLYGQAKQFVVENNSSEKFAAAAQEQSLNLRRASNLTENENNVNNLTSARPIVKWAFDANLGDVSDVFECGEQFVVAALDDVDPSEYASLEDKSFELRAELMRNAKAKNLLEQLASAKSLDEAGKVLEDTVHTTQNVGLSGVMFAGQMEPAVLGAISVLDVDQLSKPIQGLNGVYVVKPVAISQDKVEFDANSQKEQLESQVSNSVVNNVWTTIRNDAEIEDNRSRFY